MASIIALLIIGAIAFLYIKQGLFASFNMAICITLAMLVAITQFDFISGMTGLNAGYCMLILFVVSAYAFRMVCDTLIKTEIYFPQMLNIVGAGFFGAVSGYFISGVLFLALQLMPITPSIVGLYNIGTPDIQAKGGIMPFYPDDVVLGIGKMVSTGSLACGNSLDNALPNFKSVAYANRLLTTLPKGTSAEKGSLKVLGTYKLTDKEITETFANKLPKSPFVKSSKTQVFLIRTQIAGNAISLSQKGYPAWKLNPFQFKLVSKQGKQTRVDFPIAYVFETLKDRKLALATPKKKEGVLDLVNFGVIRHATASFYDARTKIREARSIKEKDKKKSAIKDAVKMTRKFKENSQKLFVDWIFILPENAKPSDLVFRNISESKIKINKDTAKFLASDDFKHKVLEEFDPQLHYNMRRGMEKYIDRKRK